MKNLLIGCILLFTGIITACNPNGNPTAKRTVIDGKVTNLQVFPNDKEFTLEVTDFGGNPTTYKGLIHKDGTFKIYFDQYIAQDVKITPIVRTFIAHPGDSIHIDIDYKSIGDVKFSGDGEKTNNDISHYTGEYYANYDDELEKRYFNNLDTANFKAACQNIKAEMLKNRDEFVDKYQPNDEVKTWTKNFINIRYYNSLLSFINYYNGMEARKSPGAAPAPLKGYVIYSDDLTDIYNTTLLNADSYKLLGYLMPRLNIKYGYDYSAVIKAEVLLIKAVYKNTLVKQLLTARLFYGTLVLNDAEDFDKNKALFDSEIQAAFIKQPLLKYYAAVKSNLSNAKIASDAIIKNLDGITAGNIIDSIRAQNKGKVIYIDFWATWCGPCKIEMPYSEKLAEKYKGKDVVFVFICLDSPKDTWKANVASLKLTGSQYFCDQQQSAGIRQGLNIPGIPYYMMINKKGDITEKGNLLRPNDPLTAHKIDRLLN